MPLGGAGVSVCLPTFENGGGPSLTQLIPYVITGKIMLGGKGSTYPNPIETRPFGSPYDHAHSATFKTRGKF